MTPCINFRLLFCKKIRFEFPLGRHLLKRFFIALTIFSLAALSTLGQTYVTTQHYDIARTGANTNETILAPSNVNTASFGKLFSFPVDGYIYAQPLYVAGVTMGEGTEQAGT